MKREITEAHREVLRRNIKKAHAVRWAGHKKKEVVKPKKSVGHPKKIVEPNSNGYQVMIGLNEYESLKEVLHNCALAGLSLTRCPSMLESTEAIKNIGNAIGEVCLEGLSQLKDAKITKKPGRKKDAKNETTSKNTT